MKYIATGCAAFALFACFDLAALKRIPYLKQLSWLAGNLLFGYCLLVVIRHGARLPVPVWVIYAGWVTLVPSILLLIYSLFLEIPFRQTYASQGTGNALVKRGTYALVRHPGVLWFGLLLLSLLMVSPSRLLLVAAPVWLLMDVLYAWVQDRFFFEKMLPGYEAYRDETPMFIPTAQSIRRCWRSMGKRTISECRSE